MNSINLSIGAQFSQAIGIKNGSNDMIRLLDTLLYYVANNGDFYALLDDISGSEKYKGLDKLDPTWTSIEILAKMREYYVVSESAKAVPLYVELLPSILLENGATLAIDIVKVCAIVGITGSSRQALYSNLTNVLTYINLACVSHSKTVSFSVDRANGVVVFDVQKS